MEMCIMIRFIQYEYTYVPKINQWSCYKLRFHMRPVPYVVCTRGGLGGSLGVVSMRGDVASADLPTAFASIASARFSGQSLSSAAYEEIMLACVEQQRGLATYRLLEEAAADGMRLGDLSSRAQDLLRPLLPPEAEQWVQESDGDSCIDGATADAATAGAATVDAAIPSRSSDGDSLWMDALPSLWVEPNPERLFECNSSTLADGWEAVSHAVAPVLFKGVAAHWPALTQWNLPLLRRSMRRAMVRVSPGPAVTFCRESHPEVRSGRIKPPSRTAVMDVGEFVDRLHNGRRHRPPLLYGDGERCYLQALAPYQMMEQTDFSFLSTASASPCPPPPYPHLPPPNPI